MGLNSRYVGNDTVLLTERAIQDLGAGVQFLRGLGFEKVVLIGNSSGAALAIFYRAQAKLTAHRFPDGDPTHLHPDDLPPACGIALCAAHQGRSKLMRDWIDPSVIDEHDPLSADLALDMYGARHRVPYSAEFLARFRAAQQARLDRLKSWALERLRLLRSTRGAWMKAGGRRIRNVDIVGGNHYLAGQAELVPRAADAIAEWANAL
ncbi:hypothetical protein [Variovorax soli]|uniref:Alpha/beta hydrolase n=1 Tax=Variovorax soli TaxID=376815 RepID=A0ABU1N8P5_9BURK|nr:hypothetical protein [Variovorax soli]MDR6534818.1 hypothetical protein [Variovorax soli]